MSAPEPGGGRLRAYGQFLAAVLYFFLARSIAVRGAQAVANDLWAPLVSQAILAFLLLFGYAAMGFWLNRQSHPFSEQGLPLRPGWPAEAGLGLATGWGLAVVCVLPMTLIGGIAISFSADALSWGWLISDSAYFALAALAEELAFRGYGFQRFRRAVGPVGASLGFAAFYAIAQSLLPGSSRPGYCVAFLFGLLLSTAYLRTRALWVSWGLNFAWKASRALLFGLAVSGVASHSPVIQGDPMGPFWLTGGGFGLEASWITFVIMLAALPFVFRITRDLDFRYNAPDLVPAGIPVDLDAAARAQHEAAMGSPEPAAPVLVQIGPAVAAQPVATGEPESKASGEAF